MVDRAAFHERRATGFGGSDIGPLLGVDRYRDSLDVYLSKVQKQTDDGFASEAMLRGIYLEPIVAQLWNEATGRRLRNAKFRRHRKYTHMIGHPDRLILATSKPPFAEIRHGPGVLELKTANRHVMRIMKAQGIPQSYVLQLNHYMGISGVGWGSFGILCPDPWEFYQFDLDFNEGLFIDVAELCERFWKEHVDTLKPPMPEPQDWSDAPALPEDEPVHMMSDTDGWRAAIEYLREAQDIKRTGEDGVKFAKGLLKELMPEQGVYEGSGARIYYRDQQGRKTFDRRSLDAMKPLDPIAMASLLSTAGLDLETIETLFAGASLDLTRFEKRGAAFTTLRMYDSKE